MNRIASFMTRGAAILALSMAAGAALAQKVTLDVLYAQPGFAKYHEPIAQAFMKAHPDVWQAWVPKDVADKVTAELK